MCVNCPGKSSSCEDVETNRHSDWATRIVSLLWPTDFFAIKNKTKLHGLSPRANYTDRATAAFRRSDFQLFADSGCHVVSVTDPYGRILGFPDKIRCFSIK
jgi:hypothetical protein